MGEWKSKTKEEEKWLKQALVLWSQAVLRQGYLVIRLHDG